MWARTCRNFLFGAAILAMFAAGAWAVNHHELNGTWQLIPARSVLNGEPAIESGTVTIRDREGNIYVSRNFDFNAANQSVTTTFSTDARANSAIKQPGLRSKTKWEGDVMRVTTTQDGITTVERYSLVNGGDMMLQVERTGHQPETLYFQRQ
jgi:hypothetical protein